MESLAAVDLSGNAIQHIEVGAFRNMSQLRTLNLNGNRLTNLTAGTFEGCGKLETLSLQDNPIESIMPGAWSDLGRLTSLTLNLGANDPQQARQGIFRGLPTLQQLTLQGTPELSAQPSWEGLEQLTQLTITGSWLGTGSVGLLPHLESKVFVGLRNLKMLDLSNNDLLYGLPDSFEGLEKLEHLDLTSNLLREVLPCDQVSNGGKASQGRICFGGVNPAIRRLRLDYNYITHIEGSAVSFFKNPQEVPHSLPITVATGSQPYESPCSHPAQVRVSVPRSQAFPSAVHAPQPIFSAGRSPSTSTRSGSWHTRTGRPPPSWTGCGPSGMEAFPSMATRATVTSRRLGVTT